MPYDKYTAIIDVDEDGGINAYGWDEFKAGLKRHPGKRFHVTATTKRSNQQNKTWWWWMEMLAEHIGELDKENVSNDIKAHVGFWNEYVHEGTGEIFKILRSTADASVAEMKMLMDKSQVFVQQHFNFVLPDPDAQLRMKV